MDGLLGGRSLPGMNGGAGLTVQVVGGPRSRFAGRAIIMQQDRQCTGG